MNNCLKKVKRLVKKTCIKMLQHSLNEVKDFFTKLARHNIPSSRSGAEYRQPLAGHPHDFLCADQTSESLVVVF